jgi:hypothetical protein
MLKVQVSPFLGVSEWVDPHSGITFSKKAGFIEIPDGTDLTNIKKYIRLNQLIFVGGTIEEAPKKVEAPVVETPKEPEPEVKVEEPVAETPVVDESKVEKPAEEHVEVPEEAPEEAPKPKKKGTPKKKTDQ